ncbi:Protein of unknown function [Cotesia congregata]|uniref:Uncharacterized protein n=1 Tax=Cotesia congregata TaxID=51543 RepID=A0A8J2HA81_COTCN|nr:Protein of unknown function [Cotesia congregata]
MSPDKHWLCCPLNLFLPNQIYQRYIVYFKEEMSKKYFSTDHKERVNSTKQVRRLLSADNETLLESVLANAQKDMTI